MKGYKGFEKGMVCKGKQYAENTVFEEAEAMICKSGMHFCENPFDVLDYYGLVDDNGDFNEFAEVEALDSVKTDDNKKYCTAKLRIGGKFSFAGFINACVDFVVEKTKIYGSSGYGAQIGSSGKNAVICCAGNGCTAKAKIGSWITLSEWQCVNGEYTPVCVKTERVDGVRIKEDTYYTLKNGVFIEV